ncbi:MAG: divergent PAP2 family protein [bacterium]|nr:divergent PAP2 family protein [bacterium]
MQQILLAPLAAAASAQILKIIIKSNGLSWNLKSLTSYSGLPSSHAAMAVSLASSAGLTQGADSPLFAVSVILSFFVIRDALGLRQYVGRQGKTVNRLIADLRRFKISLSDNYPELEEKVGHTPAQIMAGAVLGFLISLAAYYLL